MKLMSWILAFAMTANVFASTATQELERSLDNYQYAMTVDWDQKDQTFYSQKTEAFFQELGNMMKDGSVSQADVVAVIEKKVTDKKQLAALKSQVSSINASTPAELAKVLSENSSKFYSRGASWEGEALTIGLGVLVVGVLAYAVWFSATHKCVAYGQAYTCTNYGSYYGGSYGGYSYGGYYGGSYSYCGYQSVCTDYEKK